MRAWYGKQMALLAVAVLALWLPSPAVGQTVDFPYMEVDGWVFSVPESAGMGPDPQYVGGTEQWRPTVEEACAVYGCSVEWVMSIIACESGGDHGTIGPNGERGVMQYNPSGAWPEMVWASPVEQIWHAAAMLSSGYQSHWVCA